MVKRIYKISTAVAIVLIAACNNNNASTSTAASISTVASSTAPTASTVINNVATSAVASEKKLTTGEVGDTLFVTEKAVVVHDASKKEIDKWEKAGPDFGESLADNMHYIDETITNAKKASWNVVRTDKNYIVFVKADNSKTVWNRGKDFEGWGAVKYEQGKAPKKVQIVFSADEFK